MQFTDERYTVESITGEDLEDWPATPLSASASRKVLTERLTTHVMSTVHPNTGMRHSSNLRVVIQDISWTPCAMD